MKKIVTSVGLLAVSATALHAAESSTLNKMQDSKAWSVQATLRGFYDDNVDTQPNNGTETAGFEVSPSVKFGLPGEQTSFNIGYRFTAHFYDKELNAKDGRSDYTHMFDLDFAHAFSPRADMSANESFVIGQEPDLLRDPAATQRISGDNIRNFAGINFNFSATQLLGFSVGYNNSYYNYDAEGPTLVGPVVVAASNSGLLDRMEHVVRLDSNWKLTPQTVGIIGYSYSQFDFLGDETIAGIVGGANAVMSDSRNSRGHTLYVGAQHIFSPTLSGNLNVGGQYFSYYNAPGGDDAQWSPYVQGGLTYAFQSKTTFDAGVRYSRSAANAAGSPGTLFVRDTEAAVFYGSLKHEIVSKLVGSAHVAAQKAKYNGGGPGVDGEGFWFYQLGLDLSYAFTQNFSANAGYSFDKLDSDLAGRSYDRNRVFLGVTAGF